MIRVVVVDDSKFMAKQVKALVERMGFEVVGVGFDGHEGVAQYESNRPDVLLLDITMPNMDGVECLQHVRRMDSDARVVMLSAIQDQETIDRCLEYGACGFLKKPIRPGSPADLERLCVAIEEAAGRTV